MNSCTKHSMLLAALLGGSAAAFAQTSDFRRPAVLLMVSA